MNIRLGVLAIALSLASGSAFAGARDQLDTFTNGLKTLEGGFTQQVFDQKGRSRSPRRARSRCRRPTCSAGST